MTRRQAENLARGNPKIKARLDAGEFDDAPRGGSGGSRGASGSSPGKPRRPPVSAGAPPGKPRARAAATRGSSGTSSRAPRATRDNGQPTGEERRRGGIREFFDGLLGG